MQKKVLVLIGVLMVAWGAQADLSDDFNRADGSVGGDWIPGGVAAWAIVSSNLVATGGNPNPAYLINTNSQAATSTNALSFVVEAEISAGEVNDITGIVWNYQDANNYQFFRFRWGNGADLLEVGQVVDGTSSVVFGKNGDDTVPLFLSQTAVFSVEYDKNNSEYTVNMPLVGGSSDKNKFTFSDSVFTGVATGGSSGIYSLFKTDAGNVYDNFQVVVVPDPSTPITPATIVGWSAVSNNVMKMVVDAPDAAENYYPKTAIDLGAGTWTNVAHSIDGFDPFVVTNLAYSAAEGTNEVIYVQANDTKGFFGIGEQ